MGALMATNKMPENRLRPKLSLLRKTLWQFDRLALVAHAKLAISDAEWNTEEFPIPPDSSTSRNEKR
ncbi:inosine-5'-monophosphate dehydrogenase 2-like [Pyrus ussuriensis x Pyrus communis]|uniref:Inosine-5'-monophosphate dehydrogenase 2-like n=1 Tax=Pyrus ussuriensis x Pyrus communis TaxID=2448454 RepID=A0A5N5GV88_9ROSA|nr:inosine-5'-monophosphate dehydrogenase 2-like [Pyrus ussuriensis x Pyrus communis]